MACCVYLGHDLSWISTAALGWDQRVALSYVGLFDLYYGSLGTSSEYPYDSQ